MTDTTYTGEATKKRDENDVLSAALNVAELQVQPNSDPNKPVWILECSNCGHEYQINGSN